jgi:hypothetical protein
MRVLILTLCSGATLAVLAGCSTTANTVPYDSSPKNTINIQRASQDGLHKVNFARVDAAPGAIKSLFCRGLGEISVTPGKTPEAFIEQAYQEELLAAGVYSSAAPVTLKGTIDNLSFSSVSPPYWDLALTLWSSNGVRYSTETRYRFKGSYAAASACENVANAFTPAVQDLVEQSIADPQFSRLIKNPVTEDMSAATIP